jgi:hypothetical protein
MDEAKKMTETVKQSIDKALVNFSLLNLFVRGQATDTVATDKGPIPTLAGIASGAPNVLLQRLGFDPTNSEEIGKSFPKLDPVTGKVETIYLPDGLTKMIKVNTVADFPVTGEDDTLYVDLTNSTFYHWATAAAAYKIFGGAGADGPQGIQGPAGPQGEIGPQGLPGPQGEQGVVGPGFKVDASGLLSDLHNFDSQPVGFNFVATDTNQLFCKTEAGWSDPISFVKGDQGEIGPIGPQGVKGDTGDKFVVNAIGLAADRVNYDNEPAGFNYLQSDTNNLYVRQDNTPGTWEGPYPFGVGVQGPVGPQGVDGPQGPQGIQGAQGPVGSQGPKGDQGQMGLRGMTGSTTAIYLDSGTVVDNDTLTFDYTKAQHYRFQLNGIPIVVFESWGTAGLTARFLFELVNGGAHEITWPAGINWINPTDGSIANSFDTSGITLNVSGVSFLELWSSDGGGTVYGKAYR